MDEGERSKSRCEGFSVNWKRKRIGETCEERYEYFKKIFSNKYI